MLSINGSGTELLAGRASIRRNRACKPALDRKHHAPYTAIASDRKQGTNGCLRPDSRQWPVVTIPTIELWGRRRLMICALAQGVCYSLITVLLRFSDEKGGANKHAYGSAAVAFFFVYYIFFGLGFQVIEWLLSVEHT
ncbi:hypothetical protein BO86DRAFT_249663 [Aspergillus japonicus CBS 114.51]|uniref:Major facilitator superfamily (MFS) profile domain-containing protein n=1 Tax=Aspergillus japonicus CBS 114.51 TaxID=1448312 RepID=A0A8T8WLZ4_ASPJA|nr:hypothetical protein BO86DRAFT_249663 [Aspergillus japonicus CBS 114.51]RAH76560.1 hypothetical protein BO86DRAFT_249663 [Aspergillus japonicus CBS 114.51]